jgi:hypothetical protein
MLELNETSVAFVWKLSETALVVDQEPVVEYLVCSVVLDGFSHVTVRYATFVDPPALPHM